MKYFTIIAINQFTNVISQKNTLGVPVDLNLFT